MFRALAALVLIALALGAGWFAWGWYGAGPTQQDTSFIVRSGSTLTGVAQQLDAKCTTNVAAIPACCIVCIIVL